MPAVENTRIIFITGGVLSGLGKGITAASIGKILQFRGYNVKMVKIDNYYNVDPGVLNPIEHGEVFVCEEVWEYTPSKNFTFRIAEIDEDFGHYERFLNINMHPSQNITAGQIYLKILLAEREGAFLGKTVQAIPHITDEIKRRIFSCISNDTDILIVEQGGTVGDFEAMLFLEAIRQIRLEKPLPYTVLVHVALVPFLESIGQLKTKPAQQSVRILQSYGLQPDIIIGRSNKFLDEDSKKKLALFCNVSYEAVFSNPDLEVTYKLPIIFEEQGLGKYLIKILALNRYNPIEKEYNEWNKICNLYIHTKYNLDIAMPGKYWQILDSYISMVEALKHAGAYNNAKINIKLIDTEKYEINPEKVEELNKVDGVLFTPGFGSRGTEGMIEAAKYIIKNDIPSLAICFGCQILFIAFCREFLGLKEANSTEINPNTPFPVVDLLPEQKKETWKGGTMRLGAHIIKVLPKTKLYEAYGSTEIKERFRHRYHLIKDYIDKASNYGLIVSGTNIDGKIIQAIELPGYWIVGTQFHPEFKSRPNFPSPIYNAFIKAVLKNKISKKD
jgi:CTP synthase